VTGDFTAKGAKMKVAKGADALRTLRIPGVPYVNKHVSSALSMLYVFFCYFSSFFLPKDGGAYLGKYYLCRHNIYRHSYFKLENKTDIRCVRQAHIIQA
jgi:hypothetical protein